jgi:hypothetical protein
MIIEEERSVSSTRCMTKSLSREFLVLRVDSMRLTREGTFPGP